MFRQSRKCRFFYQKDLSPIKYFQSFFDENLEDLIIHQSNLFALQNDINKPLNLNREELQCWLGIVVYMSLVKIPSTKSYWRKELEQTFVTELMTRDKWHEIKKFIHFNDNKKSSKIGSPTYDPISKIRPIFEMIRKKFRLLPLHTIFSVDEQMIPFKGRSNIKQYVPSKPYKWGYKLFVLCSTDGVMYDMIPYTGKMELDEECKDLGVSSSVV